MSNLSAPVLDRQAVGGCGCFADAAPMPMGCAACGHAPYAHGCPDRPADHEYAQPSAVLMDTRLRVRRTGDRSLPCFELPCFEPPALAVPAEMIPLVPAQQFARRPARQVPVETTAPVAEQRPGERVSAETVAPVAGQRSAGRASVETAPPVIVPRRPEQAPAAVPVSPLRRVRCPLRPLSRGTRTGPPRPGGGRRRVPRTGRRTCAPPRAMPTLPPYRPPGRYGTPLHAFPHPMKRARPPLPTNRRALDRIEVQSMNDGRSTTPEPTTIPGWRLILSDAGRLWASREQPFSPAAFHAGAERTVDGDSLEALRAETDRQEALAQEANTQQANAQAAAVTETATGQVIS
ncbi:hypothetical protein OG884_15190 [Streptosporangium sp. NBC_01755]|uniref:hypothetical protein n=1 Tax=Streptosporangium sp. NBC_01755 TaxID=2975949 RepID=UPI002DD7E7B5|nr:hypothetical protein [Streptosporangium sp. NBC_01755]WSD03178.1 hypothetical protein OG884_15190 [Streptosporangium sp. NBC_01755]